MSNSTYQIGTFQGSPFFVTVEIEAGADKPDRLSICGQHRGGGGQNLETLRAMVAGKDGATWAPGWSADLAGKLADVWEKWHLNDMRSGCIHQRHGGTYRQHQCRTCGSSWRAEVRYSEHTQNLSGEASQHCPTCGERAAQSGPQQTMEPWKTDAPIEFEQFSIEWDERRRIERDADSGQPPFYREPAGLLRLLERANVKPFGFAAVKDVPLRAKLAARFEFIGEHDTKARADYETRKRCYSGGIRAFKPFLLVRRETKTAGWIRPAEHPAGLLCKPCDVCGYAYGSRWLSEEIPADVRAFLAQLPTGDPRSPYDIAATAFLERFHLRLTAEHERAKASEWGGSAAQHWRVTITNGRARSLSFDFWNSQHDTEKKIPLSAYGVLACLSSDVTTDEDTIRELNLPRKQAAAALRFGRKLRAFFTEDERAALQDIR